jgi:Na+/melibiose symporter and related transporters
MIADSVEYVEWKTGNRTEGITVSFQTLMNKLMTALQVGSVSLALILVKFIQPKEIDGELVVQSQTRLTTDAFFWLITIFPALGWILSTVPISFYKFIEEERELAHRELAERREKLN